MTTDPALQSLFAATEQRYDDEEFTVNVMKKSRFVRFRMHIIAAISLAVMIAAITLLSADVQLLIIELNNVLTTDIFEFGDGVAAVALDPINTIAGVLFITGKLVHLIYKWAKK